MCFSPSVFVCFYLYEFLYQEQQRVIEVCPLLCNPFVTISPLLGRRTPRAYFWNVRFRAISSFFLFVFLLSVFLRLFWIGWTSKRLFDPCLFLFVGDILSLPVACLWCWMFFCFFSSLIDSCKNFESFIFGSIPLIPLDCFQVSMFHFIPCPFVCTFAGSIGYLKLALPPLELTRYGNYLLHFDRLFFSVSSFLPCRTILNMLFELFSCFIWKVFDYFMDER